MSTTVEQHMFVLTDATNNNNKFWEATLYDNNDCLCRWGRVGADGQSKMFNGIGKYGMESKIREKTGKGYREVQVMGKAASAEQVSKTQLKEVATSELAGKDPILKELVTRLAEANKHQIMQASGGQMHLDLSTGIISTPVGVVTLDNIQAARKDLLIMAKYVETNDFDANKFVSTLNEYLMLVPQKVGHSRGWHRDFLENKASLQRQNTLLDQLETSVDLASKQLASAAKQSGTAAPSQIFDVKISVVEDKKIISAIEKIYKAGYNQMHASRNLKPYKVYEVELPHMAKAYETDGATLSNIMRLWHGTRAFNVLSILKNGLIIPKNTGTYQITGRMFGDGLYFSDQSTKSLNYSYGYWDGSAKDNECFMFLADVGMGKYYVPNSSNSRLPMAGYDSTFAQAGKSGVHNNEMIVYRTPQANLKYLVEFRAPYSS